jgi:hypothetical protein
MKKFLLSLAALSVLCATPVLAADVSSTPAVCSTPAAVSAAPVAPSLPADLFNPAPTDRGLMGPCTITVNCPCPCGIVRVSCSGLRHCVGGGGVSCDDGPFHSCTQACLTCNA